MNSTHASGLLEGIRILDLTSVIMGPFATHILADLGADVIKVESEGGDSFRQYKPMRNPGMGGSFLNLHRNKRSIVLDLKDVHGKTAIEKLIATADVFVHSLRPHTIANLGLDYQRVRSLKSDIVYCGAYGFGAAGPYAHKAAYDDLIQAGSGLSSMFETVTGAPAYVPTVVCDKLCGQAIAYAILAGLFYRARTGRGQEIEVPMFETAIEFNLLEHMQGFAFEPSLGPPGFDRMLTNKRKPYETKNGYACILPYSDGNWRDFYEFTGHTEFLHDPRYQSLAERVRHIDVLYDFVAKEALLRTTEEWVLFCDRVNIPCMPVRRLNELTDDAHVKSVQLFSTAVHPTEGPYKLLRPPITFGASPFVVRRHAPTLGENTVEILNEVGMSPEAHTLSPITNKTQQPKQS